MWFLFQKNRSIENIIYAAYTDTGARNGTNQDAFFAEKRDDLAVFCVADGIGGHSKGEVASGEIIYAVTQWYNSLPYPFKAGKEMLFNDFERMIKEVNMVIYKNFNKAAICGATVVAMILFEGKFCVISAGDSRVYRNEGRKMVQITRDDVWENLMGSKYEVSNNGKLLKAIGISDNLICNRLSGSIRKKDFFFLCSDGVYKVMGEDAINELPMRIRNVKNEMDLGLVLNSIRKNINEKGASDNNTGILIMV